MIQETIQQRDIILVNIYVGAPTRVKEILMDMKWEINRHAVIAGEFNTPLTAKDRSSRQKINKETAALNDTLDQMDFIDVYGEFHPKAAEYTYFPSEHGTLSKMDDMLGHKTSLNKYKKVEIISIFSAHNTIKLQINHKKDMKNM